MPLFIHYIFYVRSDGLQLDIDRWEKETNNALISKLWQIHPALQSHCETESNLARKWKNVDIYCEKEKSLQTHSTH